MQPVVEGGYFAGREYVEEFSKKIEKEGDITLIYARFKELKSLGAISLTGSDLNREPLPDVFHHLKRVSSSSEANIVADRSVTAINSLSLGSICSLEEVFLRNSRADSARSKGRIEADTSTALYVSCHGGKLKDSHVILLQSSDWMEVEGGSIEALECKTKALITDSTIGSILIEGDSPYLCLVNTTIEGDVYFRGGMGKVYRDRSTVKGRVFCLEKSVKLTLVAF